MSKDELLMLVRLGMQAIGGVLMYRGMGDAALMEALTGLAVSAAGVVWSWHARKALRDQASLAVEKVRDIAADALRRADPPKG